LKKKREREVGKKGSLWRRLVFPGKAGEKKKGEGRKPLPALKKLKSEPREGKRRAGAGERFGLAG